MPRSHSDDKRKISPFPLQRELARSHASPQLSSFSHAKQKSRKGNETNMMTFSSLFVHVPAIQFVALWLSLSYICHFEVLITMTEKCKRWVPRTRYNWRSAPCCANEWVLWITSKSSYLFRCNCCMHKFSQYFLLHSARTIMNVNHQMWLGEIVQNAKQNYLTEVSQRESAMERYDRQLK